MSILEAFYDGVRRPTANVLVLSADGNGIVMLPAALAPLPPRRHHEQPLGNAGFDEVKTHDALGNPLNTINVATRSVATPM
ncbi:MAG TPA: hypothetical protein VI094_19950 [Propionibacteriaceae bacterium]